MGIGRGPWVVRPLALCVAWCSCLSIGVLCVICGEPILPYVMGVLQLFWSYLRPAGGIFVASLSHLCRIFVVSLSYLCRIFVVSLTYLCHIFVISVSYLCRIFVSIFVWGHLSPEPVARLALAHLAGPVWALAEVTTKNAGPEHVWSSLVKK